MFAISILFHNMQHLSHVSPIGKINFQYFIYTLLFLRCVAHCGRPVSWQTWDILKIFLFLCWTMIACHRNVMLPSAGQQTSGVRGKAQRGNDQNDQNILWGEKYFRLSGECRPSGELLRLHTMIKLQQFHLLLFLLWEVEFKKKKHCNVISHLTVN